VAGARCAAPTARWSARVDNLIQQFKVDYAVVGASAIERTRPCSISTIARFSAQAIIANARHVILVADSTKFRRTAPVRIGHISQVQTSSPTVVRRPRRQDRAGL